MRLLRRNKQILYYAKYIDQEELPSLDENGDPIYDEIDGEQVQRMSGIWKPVYGTPVRFFGNIHGSGIGEAIARAYGISLAEFEAVLVLRKGEYDDIDEQTLIWYANPPKMVDGKVDYESADYKVKRVPPCLDEKLYVLGRLDSDEKEDDSDQGGDEEP